ncbi:MAG: hypothetical protein KAX50_09930 [Saprospiraceae bacterium]|nr:hypothetical protein [Saprospiraceae bacterium]
MRPSKGQMSLYYDRNGRAYVPDFIVETQDHIWIVEPKLSKDMASEDVVAKTKAALHYTRLASDFNRDNGGKPWGYLLIPHDEVILGRSINYFIGAYQKK